jgi:hypothetical protein
VGERVNDDYPVRFAVDYAFILVTDRYPPFRLAP